MKPLFVCLVFALFSLNLSYAQEATPEAEGWPVVQRCIEQATEPPDGWTFEGTIFTHGRFMDGVHAYRADVPSRYYVAFDSQSEFAEVGALSPDGRWFAVPHGRTEYGGIANRYYIVEEIRVYSTHPSRDTYRIPWDYYVHTSTGLQIMGSIMWLDNEQFIFPNHSIGELTVVNPFTGAVSVWERNSNVESRYLGVSVDSGAWGIAFYESDGWVSQNQPAPDFSGEARTLKVINVTENVIYNTCVPVANDISGRVVISPLGNQVAFNGAGGFVYILDIPTWQAYRLNLAANYLIGWYITE
jgi:hypothetical protein